ncbi:MAG: histidinol dehydrogenase [Lentisphaerae bacterium]|nr:histidinol dehydrogenase [Lentisphaerota bacterium]
MSVAKFSIERWSLKKRNATVEAFLNRPAFDERAESVAAKMLADIRRSGESAILKAAHRFQGGVNLTSRNLRVSAATLAAAERKTPPAAAAAVRDAYSRVTTFAKAGLRREWTIPTPGGGSLGERYHPMERVGVYIPGGTAPLASTAVMTAALAQVAGVPQIVACTPCAADGTINPVLLFALTLAGVTEVYKVGGIQAIGLMAYGTEKIHPVHKIVGPGNAYVTAAKRQVYGVVAIDQVAGPSEIAILADETANPAWVAADLLSQAEHGSGLEKSLLVTNSEKLAGEVVAEVTRQTPLLTRRDAVDTVIANNGMLAVVTPNLDQGMELCNRFAPEHFEIITADAQQRAKTATTAGALFIGGWTPESAGDFVAGPSHVLPTGGAAKMFSGLTADDFRRRMSIVNFTEKDLTETRRTIETFGAVEGLDAHARAATIRFENI